MDEDREIKDRRGRKESEFDAAAVIAPAVRTSPVKAAMSRQGPRQVVSKVNAVDRNRDGDMADAREGDVLVLRPRYDLVEPSVPTVSFARYASRDYLLAGCDAHVTVEEVRVDIPASSLAASQAQPKPSTQKKPGDLDVAAAAAAAYLHNVLPRHATARFSRSARFGAAWEPGSLLGVRRDRDKDPKPDAAGVQPNGGDHARAAGGGEHGSAVQGKGAVVGDGEKSDGRDYHLPVLEVTRPRIPFMALFHAPYSQGGRRGTGKMKGVGVGGGTQRGGGLPGGVLEDGNGGENKDNGEEGGGHNGSGSLARDTTISVVHHRGYIWCSARANKGADGLELEPIYSLIHRRVTVTRFAPLPGGRERRRWGPASAAFGGTHRHSMGGGGSDDDDEDDEEAGRTVRGGSGWSISRSGLDGRGLPPGWGKGTGWRELALIGPGYYDNVEPEVVRKRVPGGPRWGAGGSPGRDDPRVGLHPAPPSPGALALERKRPVLDVDAGYELVKPRRSKGVAMIGGGAPRRLWDFEDGSSGDEEGGGAERGDMSPGALQKWRIRQAMKARRMQPQSALEPSFSLVETRVVGSVAYHLPAPAPTPLPGHEVTADSLLLDPDYAAILPRRPQWGFAPEPSPNRARHAIGRFERPRRPLNPNWEVVRPRAVTGAVSFALALGRAVEDEVLRGRALLANARAGGPGEYAVDVAWSTLQRHVPGPVFASAADRWARQLRAAAIAAAEAKARIERAAAYASEHGLLPDSMDADAAGQSMVAAASNVLWELAGAYELTRPRVPAWSFLPFHTTRSRHIVQHGMEYRQRVYEVRLTLVKKRTTSVTSFRIQLPREVAPAGRDPTDGWYGESDPDVRAEVGRYQPSYELVERAPRGVVSMSRGAMEPSALYEEAAWGLRRHADEGNLLVIEPWRARDALGPQHATYVDMAHQFGHMDTLGEPYDADIAAVDGTAASKRPPTVDFADPSWDAALLPHVPTTDFASGAGGWVGGLDDPG
eukprot:jgi/Mesvir1/4094/Mv16056-RA.2